MEEFPSDLELTAASALLILSCEDELSSTTNSSMSIMEGLDFARELENKSETLEFGYFETSTDDTTTLCNSSMTSDDSVHDDHSKLVITDDILLHEMKLKVNFQAARRARTKVVYRSTGDRNLQPITTTTTEGSCLSSGGSSEINSAAVRQTRRRRREGEVEVKRRGVGSAHIRRRAAAIMGFLSAGGCASEVRIRQVIGDSPDTSKALRVLLKMEQIKRSGRGGRPDPYIYRVAVETDSIAHSFGM